MGASRALGGLLCVVCAIVIFFYVSIALGPWLKWWLFGPHNVPLWLVLPVIAGVLILAGLGFWLGWIMASTKEISPPTAIEKPVVKRRRKRRK